MEHEIHIVCPVTVRNRHLQPFPLPPYPGFLQAIWALKVGAGEQLEVVRAEGLALGGGQCCWGPSAVQGRAPVVATGH